MLAKSAMHDAAAAKQTQLYWQQPIAKGVQRAEATSRRHYRTTALVNFEVLATTGSAIAGEQIQADATTCSSSTTV